MPPPQQRQQDQQEQEQRHQQQQQRLPLRDTQEICDFCANERPHCNDGLPRCRCPVPHGSKQSTSKPKAATARQQRGSKDSKRPVGPPQLSSRGGTGTAPREQRVSGLSGVASWKRCRLGASPATGLVGMQENAFLSDYFACLGFLPIASASMVRQAMVNIMLGSMPQRGHERFPVRAGGLARGKQANFTQQGQEGGLGQMLASQDNSHYPSKCIFWCAIALGALIRGCSSDFVTGYLKLARASLAECFDEDTVETARAYLVMAFLHRFLGDEENNQKHLAFANSIVERLPQDLIPPGMENMLLVHGDESSFVNHGYIRSGVGINVRENLERRKQIPKAKSCMHEKDLCNFYFFTGQYMHKAFLKDNFSGGVLEDNAGEGGVAGDRGVEEEPSECQEQGEHAKVGGMADWEGGDLEAPLRSSGFAKPALKSRGSRDPLPAGSAIKTFVKDVLPEMAILLAVVERPGTCSGVGSFFFHSVMGYMKAVKGDMRSSFGSMKACAEVLMRFPGLCRYRPHVTHAVLTAAASSKRRSVYDPVRDIYNSILPWNGMPAPPMEEWGATNPICNHLLCRSLMANTNNMDFASNISGFARAKASSTPAPTAPSSDLDTSSVTGETHESLGCEVYGSAATSVGEAEMVATAQRLADAVPLPSPALA